MSHAKSLMLVAGLVLVAVACGSVGEDAFSEKSGPSSNPDAKAGGTSSSSSSGGFNSQAVGSPAATGVVIAHSATFPSFRLCFQNYPDKLPQPDAKVMPDANVVGVEVGSAVRIDPLPDAPGIVYVIDEARIRLQSGEENAPTCGALIQELGDAGKGPDSLQRNKDYYTASAINKPLGVGTVDVLAISGCGDGATLENLDPPPAPATAADVPSCGSDWKVTGGNLKANVITLTPSGDGPTDSDIPVALFNLAPALNALGGEVTVKFGPQSGSGDTVSLTIAKTAFTDGNSTRLAVDQKAEESYGRFGFEISAKVGANTVVTKQTLADVQQLSAPGDVPTTYYRAASNYALLLLGDPSHVETNPSFNPRRALHVLAVPVLDPSKLPDGGAGEADGSVK